MAIALISAAVLAYEVLLMSLFSLIQWHHFAYLVVSVALLGFGASGSFLVLVRKQLENRFRGFAALQACGFGIGALLCFALAQHLSFNPEELIWDHDHWLRLALVILLLALPFFFAANLIGLALMQFRQSLARIYAFDLVGAGIGAAAIIALLFQLSPDAALRLVSFAGFAAAAVLWIECRGRLAPVLVGLPVAALCLILLPAHWTEPQLSQYKGLTQLLRMPGTQVVAERFSPLGQVSVVESKTVPLRHAPGMSLNAEREPPAQLGLVIDGDSLSAITRFTGDLAELGYLDYLTSALPYHLRKPRRVLILEAGGGAGVLQALYHGAGQIDAVELDPAVAGLVRDDFGDFSGRIYDLPQVRLHIAEPRGFLQGSNERFDLVQFPILDAVGGGASGVHGLNENYLYTVEALRLALARLADNGILAITSGIDIPPRDSLKLFAGAVAALETEGVERVDRRLALIRGWQTSTLLVRNGEFNGADIDAIREFCTQRSFDLAWYPGMLASEANRINQFDQAYFHDAARALLGDGHERFMRDYKFDLEPATDDRPFHFNFVKLSSLPELIELRQKGGGALLETGYLTLVITLALALLLSLLLILLPLAFIRRETPRITRPRRNLGIVTYFFALGLGFLLIEIVYLQQFILLLHHPVYAAAVVLASFLVAAGLGSAWSQRFAGQVRSKRVLVTVVVAIVALGLAQLALFEPLQQFAGDWPLASKIGLAIVLIAPLGFCMGMPFPLGLSALATAPPALTAWAWGINGCASVISATLATLLAIHAGFDAVIVLALVCYLAAAASFPKT
ncbi:MAG: SAM-dependent methyltransferase [Gammaproteobacteria bacterium]|nr:SAM-dependent methyltransferase [Gammaproteobacteria bacterium]